MTSKENRSINIQGDVTNSIVVSGNDNILVGVSGSGSLTFDYVHQAPALPAYYVTRPEVLTELKHQLTTKSLSNTLVISAIYGLGGIGKSVLASAISQEEEILSYFSDGVLWVTLGQTPQLLPLLDEWIKVLGDDFSPASPEAASSHLRSLLRGKRVLLVIDDVWDSAHADFFRVGSGNSSILITTREAVIPEANRYDLDVMAPAQSLKLLKQAIRRDFTEKEEDIALKLSKALGYLPLALELAAAQIVDGASWRELLSDLQSEVVRLESFDAPGTQFMSYKDRKRRNHSLTASLNLSLNRLPPAQLVQFSWLGILAEDTAITGEVAATLWQVSERKAEKILRFLRQRALVSNRREKLGKRKEYQLHDIVRYSAHKLIQSAVTPDNASELSGLGLTLCEAHKIFLDKYTKKTRHRRWHTLPHDGYIHSNLVWHFKQAKESREIHKIFSETTEGGRDGWYEACEKVGKASIFMIGLNQAWELAKSEYSQDACSSVSRQCRYALTKSSINSLMSNIPSELVLLLVEYKVWMPAQGLAHIQGFSSPEQQARMLEKVSRYLSGSLLIEALKTAKRIKKESGEPIVISRVIEEFPELLPEVIDLMATSGDESKKEKVVLILSKNIQKSLLPYAINSIQTLSSRKMKKISLEELVCHSPKELIPDIFALSKKIEDTEFKAYVIRELAHSLPQNLTSEALEISQLIDDEKFKADFLTRISNDMPQSLMSGALKMLQKFQNQELISTVIQEFANHLPQNILPEALKISQQIESEYFRARAMRALAYRHSYELSIELLDLCAQFQDNYYRVMLLSALAASIPSLVTEVLELLEQIQAQKARSRSLFSIAEVLTPLVEGEQDYHEIAIDLTMLTVIEKFNINLLPKALSTAKSIRNESLRAKGFIELTRKLPEGEMVEIIPLVSKISEEALADSVLYSVADNVRNEFPKVLTIIQSLSNEGCVSKALCAFAHRITDDLVEEALNIAKGINSTYFRAEVMAALGNRLPDSSLADICKLILQVQDSLSRKTLFNSLFSSLSKTDLLTVLRVSQHIKDASKRTDFLNTLAKRFDSKELVIEALKITQSTQDNYLFVQAMIGIACQSPSLSYEVFDLIQQIEDKADRVAALASFSEEFCEYFHNELLEIAMQLEDSSQKMRILSNISAKEPSLVIKMLKVFENIRDKENAFIFLDTALRETPSYLLAEVLLAVQKLRSERHQAQILGVIAHKIPKTLVSEVLSIAEQLWTPHYKASALCSLIPNHPEFADKALQLTEIMSEDDRNSTLRMIVDQLPIYPCYKGFELIRKASNDYHKGIMLNSIIPKLSEEKLIEAFELTVEIEDDFHRSWPLDSLAERASGSLLVDILSYVRTIEDSGLRTLTFSILARKLPYLLDELIESTDTLHHNSYIELVVNEIASKLPETLFSEVLQLTQEIKDERGKADSLYVLAIRSPSYFLNSAINHAFQIQDKNLRVESLRSIAGIFTRYSSSTVSDAFGDKDNKFKCFDNIDKKQSASKEFEATLSKWNEFLHRISTLNRDDFLRIFPELAPSIKVLSGDSGLKVVSRVVQEVIQKW